MQKIYRFSKKKLFILTINSKKWIYICTKVLMSFDPLSGTKQSPVKPIKSLRWAMLLKGRSSWR